MYLQHLNFKIFFLSHQKYQQHPKPYTKTIHNYLNLNIVSSFAKREETKLNSMFIEIGLQYSLVKEYINIWTY